VCSGCDLKEDSGGQFQKLLFEERLRKLLSSPLLENVCNGDDLMEKAVLNNIRSWMVASWPNEKDVLLSSNRC
jgi:hypothetical protein